MEPASSKNEREKEDDFLEVGLASDQEEPYFSMFHRPS